MRTGIASITCFSVLLLGACQQAPKDLAPMTVDGHVAPLLENLGSLHVEITTSESTAQRFFDQGMTLLYGFNHDEAIRSFQEVARIDPDCAMAHWGIALATGPNTNDPAPGPEREQAAHEAVQEALKRMSRRVAARAGADPERWQLVSRRTRGKIAKASMPRMWKRWPKWRQSFPGIRMCESYRRPRS